MKKNLTKLKENATEADGLRHLLACQEHEDNGGEVVFVYTDGCKTETRNKSRNIRDYLPETLAIVNEPKLVPYDEGDIDAIMALSKTHWIIYKDKERRSTHGFNVVCVIVKGSTVNIKLNEVHNNATTLLRDYVWTDGENELPCGKAEG